jgi:riboflavin synthase
VFTGIIDELGEVAAVQRRDDESARLTVRSVLAKAGAQLGDSIAVNGVCLTVVELYADAFTADVMKQTLDRSALRTLVVGAPVNLERPATLQSRLGGHLVQGHVDGTGEVVERHPAEHWHLVRIALPDELNRYVVAQGSIAVDGVSLTVASVDDRSFTVGLIPTTLETTTLGRTQPGDRVNLEVDVLAKYVEKLLPGARL